MYGPGEDVRQFVCYSFDMIDLKTDAQAANQLDNLAQCAAKFAAFGIQFL